MILFEYVNIWKKLWWIAFKMFVVQIVVPDQTLLWLEAFPGDCVRIEQFRVTGKL